MYIPVVNKPQLLNGIFFERALPNPGMLTAKVGDKVEPFSRLGMSKTAYHELRIDGSLKLARNRKEGSFFYEGEKIGTIKMNKVSAPYNGYLKKDGENYVFIQEERDYWLLSGVWGEVARIVKDTSVLLKTQTIDLKMVYSTGENISGELLIFPNPADSLVIEYLQNFDKNIAGKIVYVGNRLSSDVLKKALELKVLGILTGSTEKNLISLAREKGMFLGLFTGFGDADVYEGIYDILKGVSNRFIFIQGENNVVRIPVPENALVPESEGKSKSKIFSKLAKGLKVMVFQKPHFGSPGVIDSISGNSILVKFPEKEELFEVRIPNVLSME